MRKMGSGWASLVVVGGLLLAGVAEGQTTPSAPVGSQAHQASTPAVKKTVRRRRVRTQTVPMETAAPARPASSGPTPADAAAKEQQRVDDARVLAQQQAQSDKAARINDEQVRRAQQRQDAQQNEIRIQDAPGPAQTGVVPAAGPPVQTPPQQPQDQRIQDQPSAVPGQNTTPPQR